ncbi:MAG: HAMP domain-containing histidine kinase [Candidatus Hydrogenedentes bacterium]|nr:HAMP domain-containing histidine kinase [Candidatus Hydrogenedentota bacterium]
MFSKRGNDRKSTLALRLAAGAAFITGSCFLASFAIVYVSLSSTIHQRLDDRLRHEAAELESLIALQGHENVQSAVSGMANAEGTGLVFYRIANRTGEHLAESDTAMWEGLAFDPARATGPLDAPYFETTTLPRDGAPVRVMYFQMASGMVLQAALRQQHELQPLYDLRRVFLVVVTVGLVASCAMGWIAAKRVLRPLDLMTRTAQNIASGNFDDRVSLASDDAELDRLASAFNAMLDRIQSFVRELREMNDSIAHDLRSALTRIQLAAGRLLATRPLSEEQESLAVAVTENATELLGLLDTIMDLSELNTGIVTLPESRVDVDELLRELVELFEMAADEKRVDLSLVSGPDAVVRGDPNRLRRAFANLIDNAVKYTEGGGRIELRTRCDPAAVVVEIQDTGTGIAEDELAHVFTRFYRADKSRGGTGHGLGLSLTDAIVRLHGGTVRVESVKGQGSTFTVTLPQPQVTESV